jgi:hypothetical protein
MLSSLVFLAATWLGTKLQPLENGKHSPYTQIIRKDLWLAATDHPSQVILCAHAADPVD